MKRVFLNFFFAAIAIILTSSCGGDKAESVPVKIDFPTVEFALPPNVDTTIFGKQGTRIFIGAGSFQFADGSPVKDSIHLELKEFYDNADIILGNLSTTSGDRLLETAGMIYLDAS